MIKVDFIVKGEDIVAYKVAGHANSAPKGEDIVCSAISILAQSTLVGLSDIISIGVQSIVRDGFIDVSLDLSDEKLLADSQILLDTMRETVLILKESEKYSKYIDVEIHKYDERGMIYETI